MKSLVLLSGGFDSATVLAEALSQGRLVEAYFFSYGQLTEQRERLAATELCNHYNVPLNIVDAKQIFAAFRSGLLEHSKQSSQLSEESNVVVPARNLVFVSILAGVACSRDANEIWLGICLDDLVVFPDCRPRFFYSLRDTVKHATDNQVNIAAPFLHYSKAQILSHGLTLNVPYHLTWSCCESNSLACGKCLSCQSRLAAFEKLGISDPIEYAEP